MNKFRIAGLVALAGLVASAPVSQAATTQQTIDALLAQIAALQAQMNGGTTVTTTTKTYVHVNTLRVGSRGTQVKQLQTCLNRLGDNTGVVDGVFGPNTKRGVMSFQAKNGLVVDGIVGPMTGPKYEMACAIKPVTPTTPTTPTTTTENEDFTLGGDGEVTDFKLKKEGDVNTDSKDEELSRFEFEVKNGDVKLDRVKLFFEEIGSPSNSDDLWENFKTVTLKLDGKEIADVDVDSKSDWTKERTGVYSLSLKGNKVIKEGFDGELKVYVTTTDEVETSSDIAKYNMWGELRFIDATGVVEEKGNDSNYTGTDKVSFDIDALSSFRISFSENRNSPDTNKSLDLSNSVTNETLAIVDADVKDNQDGTLEDARVMLAVTGGSQISSGTTGTAALADLVNEVAIYIDGKKIDTASTAEGVTTNNGTTVGTLTDVTGSAQVYAYKLDLSDYEVKKDKEYKVEVKADFKKLKSTDKHAGTTVMVSGLTFKGENQSGTNIPFGNTNVTTTTSYAPTFTASAGDIKVTWVQDPVVYKDAVDTNYDGEFIVVKVNIDNDSGATISGLETIGNWVFDVDGYAIDMAAVYSAGHTNAGAKIAKVTDKNGVVLAGTCSGADTASTNSADCTSATINGGSGSWAAATDNLADGAQKEYWITLPYNATSTQDFKVELKTLAGKALGDVWSK